MAEKELGWQVVSSQLIATQGHYASLNDMACLLKWFIFIKCVFDPWKHGLSTGVTKASLFIWT